MSHTANQEFQVARVVYGVPKDSSSVQKMEHWVKRNCLDYRRDDDGDSVVVTIVLRYPKKGHEIRDNVKHQARRWGFVRRSREQRQVEFTSINSYMEGGVGALLKDNVRELLGSSYEKVEQREQDCKKQRVEQNREKARAPVQGVPSAAARGLAVRREAVHEGDVGRGEETAGEGDVIYKKQEKR